jgi:hypothetical protein
MIRKYKTGRRKYVLSGLLSIFALYLMDSNEYDFNFGQILSQTNLNALILCILGYISLNWLAEHSYHSVLTVSLNYYKRGVIWKSRKGTIFLTTLLERVDVSHLYTAAACREGPYVAIYRALARYLQTSPSS